MILTVLHRLEPVTIKVGGNYAASLRAGERAHKEGYSAAIFLDAKEKKYIDEAGPANFFGIKNNTYVTPEFSFHSAFDHQYVAQGTCRRDGDESGTKTMFLLRSWLNLKR